MSYKCLPEITKIVQMMNPAADAGGRTGDYISLKNAQMVELHFNITQGNAATIALSLSAASDVAGTGAAAATGLFEIWSDLDTAAGDALVRRTDAASYTTDAGVKNKVIVFRIDPAKILAQNSAFDCIAPVTGASNAANITSCMAYVFNRYKQATPPSAIID